MAKSKAQTTNLNGKATEMTENRASELLSSAPPPESPVRFADGAQYRIEIPSTEGPKAFQAMALTMALVRGLHISVISLSLISGINAVSIPALVDCTHFN